MNKGLMMRTQRHKLILFFLAGLVLLLGQDSGLAQSEVHDLSDRVVVRTSQGRASGLIHELAALLIINENDDSALEQILNLGRRQDVSSVDRLLLLQLESLYQQRNNLLVRIQDQKKIQQELRKGFEALDPITTLESLPTADSFYPEGGLPTGILTRLPDELMTGNPLESLNRQLGQQTLFYEAQLVDLRRQNDIMSAQRRKQKLASRGGSFLRGNPVLAEISNDRVGQIRQELGILYDQMRVLRDEVEFRNQTIDRLSGEVMTLTLDSVQKDQYLQDKFKNVDTLHDELAEMESRFRFGQKIIEEKDNKIDRLEKNLAELNHSVASFKNTFQQDLQTRERQMAEFAGILEIYQAKLKEAVDLNAVKDRQIQQLADDLALLRDSLGNKNDFFGRTFRDLGKLQDEVRWIKSQLEAFTAFESPGPLKRNLRSRVHDLEHQLESTRVFLEQFQFE